MKTPLTSALPRALTACALTVAIVAAFSSILANDANAKTGRETVRNWVLTYFGGGQIGGTTIVGAAQMAVDDFGATVRGKKIQTAER